MSLYQNIGRSSSGMTQDFDSCIIGSIPIRPATMLDWWNWQTQGT